MDFIRRLSVLLATLALTAGNSAVCAGWLPTAEARMACCSRAHPCPMHESDAHHGSSPDPIDQAHADSCCAASERHEDGAPSSPLVLLPAAPAETPTALAVIPEPATALRVSHAHAPPAPSLPRHLLLTVLLV
jgi:hypothetical protein